MVEEDEIDLRPYIAVLLRRWWLILGLAVAAAAIAAAVSLASPATYEASATVAIANLGTQPTPQAKAYLELATGQGVLEEVGKNLPTIGGETLTYDDLKSKLSASAGADPALVKLQARESDPRLAAEMATIWAQLFVRTARATFNGSAAVSEQVETQLKLARQELTTAEEELAGVQARDRTEVLQVELNTQRSVLAGLYSTRASLQVASQDVAALRDRLRRLDPGSPVSPGDDVAAILLQAAALVGSGGPSPQLQIPMGASEPTRTVGSLLAYVDRLAAAVDDKARATDKRIAALEAELTDLNNQYQRALAETAAATTRRDNARQVVKDLDLKAAQARAAAQEGAGQVRIVGDTTVPAEPLPRGTARNAAVAAMLGFMAALVAAFGRERLARRSAAPARSLPTPQAGVTDA